MTKEIFDLSQVDMSLNELFQRDIKKEQVLFGPILDPTITLLHAPPGIGKTLLVHEIALTVFSGHADFMSDKIKWRLPKQASSVVIVDGEMPLLALQKRLKTQAKGRDGEMHLLTNAELFAQNQPLIEIDRKESRDLLSKYFQSIPGLKLVILDNLTTLTSGKFNEDSSTDQRPINQWLARLRDAGLSVILVHHDSKSGDQRGSSDRSSICDLVIHMYPAATSDGTHAHFNVEYTKSRWLEAQPIPFSAENLDSQWIIRSKEETKVDELLNHMEICKKFVWRDVAQELGVCKSRVYTLRSKAKVSGQWSEDWD